MLFILSNLKYFIFACNDVCKMLIMETDVEILQLQHFLPIKQVD